MEGPITKLEMRHQLFQHMKPNSAPGMDGFTVSWVKSSGMILKIFVNWPLIKHMKMANSVKYYSVIK